MDCNFLISSRVAEFVIKTLWWRAMKIMERVNGLKLEANEHMEELVRRKSVGQPFIHCGRVEPEAQLDTALELIEVLVGDALAALPHADPVVALPAPPRLVAELLETAAMVDVDRKMAGLNQAHLAGLRRLSARAAARTATSSRKSLDTPLQQPGLTPRWAEFWSDAAVEWREKTSNKSSSSTSPDRSFDVSRSEPPKWVEKYIEQIGSTLKQGGWDESDVAEIVHVSSCPFIVGEFALLDNQAVMDSLLVKADRLSDSLRQAGWSSEEVSNVLWLDSRADKQRKPGGKLSPELVE
nr:Serine/threonine-protein kinase [Ipomoea batatas]